MLKKEREAFDAQVQLQLTRSLVDGRLLDCRKKKLQFEKKQDELRKVTFRAFCIFLCGHRLLNISGIFVFLDHPLPTDLQEVRKGRMSPAFGCFECQTTKVPMFEKKQVELQWVNVMLEPVGY